MRIFAAVACFWVGVAISNIAQWGKWIKLHPADRAVGYWKQGGGWGHAMGNFGLDALFCAAWATGLIDMLQARGFSSLPGGYPIPGYLRDVPVTPGLGIILGLGADFIFDYAAFMLRGKIPFLSRNSEPPTVITQENQ